MLNVRTSSLPPLHLPLMRYLMFDELRLVLYLLYSTLH